MSSQTPRRILAIDPGVTTGAVLYDPEEDRCVAHWSLHNLDSLEQILEDLRYGELVVEEAPPHHAMYRNVTEAIESRCRAAAKRKSASLHWVRPAQWKNTPLASGRLPVGLTQHERDALSIARWYRATTRRTTNAQDV